MGPYGAALATAIGFFAVWMIRYIWVINHVNLKNCRIKEPVSYALLGLQMILAYWGNDYVFAQIGIFVIQVLLYGKETKKMIRGLLRKISGGYR
jgi:O-antigen/teichoic acid export membrane protein